MAASFILKSLGFMTILVVNWQQVLILWTVKFNLEAALETNVVIESDVKELIKK